jgi:hypothetical protein
MTLAPRAAVLALLLAPWWIAPALAKTLEVGPNAEYKLPSAALEAANNHDVVNIAPGTYFDCAIIKQNYVTIQGSGPGVVMTDRSCGGKALLVVRGSDIVIRNLTLQRSRVPDGNGAGIRYEGGNMTVENVKFINNQDGILGAPDPDGTVRIIGSEFLQNGSCAGACSHGVYFNALKLLHIEKSRFFETKEGHHIKSRALRTEVIDSEIADGESGSSSYLIEVPNGGSLIVRNNKMQKGIHSQNQANAIMIGAEGTNQPTEEIIIANNTFVNDQNRPTTFVHNITATPAQLIGNKFEGQVRPLEGDGSIK